MPGNEILLRAAEALGDFVRGQRTLRNEGTDRRELLTAVASHWLARGFSDIERQRVSDIP